MKEVTPKSKFIKRILGIAVPTLIMVITIIMVSVSFAWFSNDVSPSVSTIKLTVNKAFTISFTAESDSNLRNINYKGQEAIDDNYRLVTDNNGRTHSSLGGAGLELYMLDAPYYFITTISLDTDARNVDMSMVLDAAKITSGNTVLNSYDSANGNGQNGRFAPDDVPYAFTWYIKEHEPDSINYKGSISGEDDMRVMDYRLPQENEVWYTPYGKLTFDADHLIKEVNGETVNNTADNGDGEERYSLINGGLKEMLFNADNANFDFYIVFAPQKLFWAQFCIADRDLTLNDIYTEQELKKIFGNNTDKQMYYSSMGYFGATFEFGATLRVSTVY